MSSPELIVDVIRHARSQMNSDMANPENESFIGGRQNEVDLSKNGEDQARRFGHYAVAMGLWPTRSYCSRARRAIRTYDLAAEVAGITVVPVIDDRLQELDQGEWTNQPRALYDEHQEEMERLGPDFAPPGGQSMNDVADLTQEFFESLDSIPGAEQPEYIWIVGHGVNTKAYFGRLSGWSHKRTYRAEVDNVSRTRFERHNGIWVPIFINERSVT